MTAIEKREFTPLVCALCETFGQESTEPRLLGYWIALRDIDSTAFKIAIEKALKSCERMPSPAELRSLAVGTDNLEERAQIAWLRLNAMIDDVGGYGSPKCDDPVLVATIKSLGGWQALCQTPQSEFDAFVRPKFMATYKSLSRVKGIMLERLIGSHEQENRKRITGNTIAGLIEQATE